MESNDVFEEWTAYARKKVLLPRDINSDSIIDNAKFKIVAVTGIRRCGKSSLLMLLLQKIVSKGKKCAYINMEDSRIKDNPEILDEALKWFGEEGYLFLDEIPNARGWEGWLSRTHELLKESLCLIVSSSRKNLVLPSKPLRGRILPFELYPLSFKEFLRFKTIEVEKTTVGRGRLEKAFGEYLKYGGFPEVVLTLEEMDKIRILDSYFKDIVSLDVAEVAKTDITTVETLGKYIVQSPYFSASKCLNFFKTIGYRIGKEKILQLEKYAQESYLFFFVPIFSYNIKDKSQYPRKTYCGDHGFYYATTGKIEFGRIFENIVFLELRRRNLNQKEICYWKNTESFETDFMMKQGTNIEEAIQVAYDLKNEKTLRREINALVKCVNETKAKKATIIAKNVVGRKNLEKTRIDSVSIIDWLLR